jgi:hypothetical protein
LLEWRGTLKAVGLKIIYPYIYFSIYHLNSFECVSCTGIQKNLEITRNKLKKKLKLPPNDFAEISCQAKQLGWIALML